MGFCFLIGMGCRWACWEGLSVLTISFLFDLFMTVLFLFLPIILLCLYWITWVTK